MNRCTAALGPRRLHSTPNTSEATRWPSATAVISTARPVVRNASGIIELASAMSTPSVQA